MNRKYLNFAIFIAIVAVVAGLAVNHSRHIRALVDAMAGDDGSARIDAAKELVRAELFLDSVAGEGISKRVRMVQALEDWALSNQPNEVDPNDKTKSFGPKDAVRQLVQFAKDPDKPVRDRVLIALMRTSAYTPENMQEDVNGLKEGDNNILRASVKSLQFLGQPDPTAAAARIPAELLPRIGISDPVQAATALLATRRPDVADLIVPKTVAILKKEGGARASGGDVLGALTTRREESVKLLVPLLADKDEGVRTGAADALGKVGSPSAIPALKDAVAHGTPQVHRVAIGAIAMIADASGEDTLIAAQDNPDEDNEARAQAATGLGRIGNAEAILRLVKGLSDYDLKVQTASAGALARAGNAAVPALTTLLAQGGMESNVAARVHAAEALSASRSPEAASALTRALQDPSVEVREAAAKALGKANNVAAVGPLIAVLADKDGAVATAAVDSLAAIGEPARAALAQALSSMNPTGAYNAAQALGKQGQGAIRVIVQETSKSTASRRWAAVALGRIGGPDSVSALKTLAADPDRETRQAASLALRRIGGT